MRIKHIGIIVASLLVLTWLPKAGWSQNSTSGAISGKVTVKSTGEPAIGATIVVTGPSLQGPQTAIAGESGNYTISGLPPGTYVMVFYYLDGQTKRTDVRININKTAYVNQKVAEKEGEVIEVRGASTIDTGSAKQSMSLGRSYLENIPMPGTSFEGALGAAAGTQGDEAGVSFSGSTSLENQYIIDGVNTTGLSYGTVGSPLANDFIEEIEIITGGYQAEYGRSTGGIANVRTKQGSNELKGTVITRWTGDAIARDFLPTPTQASSIDAVNNITSDWQIGFDLGGPIIKDKLWFYVGFQPQFISRRTDRLFKRRRDCFTTLPDGSQSICDPDAFGDGAWDEDEDGQFIYENVGKESFNSQQQTYQFIAKINYALSPEHQGVFSVTGQPFTNEIIGVYGSKDAVSVQQSAIAATGTAEWTSKFNDNKTEIQARLGYYAESFKQEALNSEVNDDVQTTHIFKNMGDLFNEFEPGLDPSIRAACTDGSPDDQYPDIENCPDEGVGYRVGGPGGKADEGGSRLSGKITALQRLTLAGDHQIKGGLDFEINKLNKKRLISGDVRYTVQPGRTTATRWVEIGPPLSSTATPDEIAAHNEQYGDLCDRTVQSPGIPCDWTPDPNVEGETFNWSAFIQDSWQILPNVTLNAGIRYEEQRLRFASDLQNTTSPFTDIEYGKNAMVIKNMWAPRVGLIYDWTKEGRSKVFTNWGRFYESIPMDINDRSFGGESFLRSIYSDDNCTNGGQGELCEQEGNLSNPQEDQLNGAGILVQPGIGGQYLDEFIVGAEYEILEDVKLGVTYENRRLGRVIEDVSLDNAATYILANPGTFSEDEANKLQDDIDQLEEGSVERGRLERQLAQFRGIRTFDKPVRNWNALKLIATKRFSKNFFVQGSYQYGRATGNYQGLFSSNNGQIDPNITSQYDLIELLANRFGPLPQDRPHSFKLDGSYTFDFQNLGQLTTGLSIRGISGTPVNAVGRHYRYGFNESVLVPRGSVERTNFYKDADLLMKYGKDLRRGMTLEVFFELFNFTSFEFLQGQQDGAVDEAYTFSEANPIVGGDSEDLVFLKTQTDRGAETSVPVNRNPNYRNLRSVFRPPYARLGLRLTF